MSALQGRDIICLASQAWETHLCTPQQIMKRLAPDARVLYVEPLRSPAWALKAAATQSRAAAGPPRLIAPGLWVLTLPAAFIPLVLYARLRFLTAFNHWLMSRWVTKTAKELGFSNPVVWVYQVTHVGAPLLREANLTVYDCIDEWAAATPHPVLSRYLTELDRQMCQEADLLFLGSEGLAASRAALNAHHALIPQGVDLQHFLPPVEPVTPADMTGMGRPVIGLIGVLTPQRLDIELLTFLARERPGWSIVLVGPVWQGLDTESLQRYPNIHLLGNKAPAELGVYLSAFDVCMLPYLINEFTRNIFPLKLFEYLASGKPFVSTPVPACMEFPELIRIGANPAEFLKEVEAALAEQDDDLKMARIELARANDWDKRALDKAALVAAALATRATPETSHHGSSNHA